MQTGIISHKEVSGSMPEQKHGLVRYIFDTGCLKDVYHISYLIYICINPPVSSKGCCLNPGDGVTRHPYVIPYSITVLLPCEFLCFH